MVVKYKEADRDQFDLVWKKKIASEAPKNRKKWQFWKEETHYSIMRNDLKLWIALVGEEPIAELYVVYKDKECLTKTSGNTVYLRSFFVKENYRNQGVFSLFLKHVLKNLKNSDYEFARIGVDEKDLTNTAIYKHWGFDKLIKSLKTADINGIETEISIYEKSL